MPGPITRNSSILRLTSVSLVLALWANLVCSPINTSSHTSPPSYVAGVADGLNPAASLGGPADHTVTSAPSRAEKKNNREEQELRESYGRLSLNFEANQGQSDPRVKFFSRGSGYGLFLTSSEAVLVLSKGSAGKEESRFGKGSALTHEQVTPEAALRMSLIGANPQPRVTGLEVLPGKSNYFIGNDPKRWRTNVSQYAKVKYEEVYPGVDVVYYGNQRQLEYNLIVAPRADASLIRLGFEGARRLHIAANGDLVLTMRDGKVRQHRPVAYQMLDGRRREIASHYVMAGKHQIAMGIGDYDRSRELVIDPVITYSTFLGGSGGENAWDLDIDAAGNAYVTGSTSSTNFPTRNPIQSSGGGADAFVTKINAAGSATVYSTYVGGSGFDVGESIKVDASGSAYVTGITESTNFPTFNAFQSLAGGGVQDAFVLKLNATGDALDYSTYLGGNSYDLGYGIAVDAAGSAYVTGSTESSNFPTLNPYDASYNSPELEDVFITKLSPAGNALVYSTFLGGSLYDEGYGITVDSLGNAYVTGYTQSADFPTAAALYPTQSFDSADAFVTKLNATGDTLVFSTFLGGPGLDIGKDITLDPSGNIYLTGQAEDGFPIVNAYQPMIGGNYDAFVTKMDPMATSIIYSTYLGGSAQDVGEAIAVDSSENVFIAGETLSPDFPKVRSLQAFYGGDPGDMFIAKFNSAGALNFSTYLGSVGEDSAEGIAIDSSSNAYVAGFARSSSFPTVGSSQPFGGNGDAVILKLTGLLSYNISGRVTDALNSGLSAVTVTLSGSQSASTQTDANGNYTFADLPSGGNYTVTPTKSPYSFVPANRTFSGLNASQTADFTVATYSISGSVMAAGNAPVSGVTVALTGTQLGTTQTDASGNYSFPAVAAGGSYTVTPSKVDVLLTYSFTPASQVINNLSNNQTANFASTASIISGLNPAADAYVQDGTSANTNFGTVTPLKVETDSKSNNGKNFDGYFKFDVSAVAGNITSVKLRIFASLSVAGSVNTSVYSVANTSWLESGANSITWSNRPARSSTPLTGATATVNGTTYATYDIDVTAYAKSEKSAGRDVISLALHNPSASAIFINVNSREASANKPQLIVTVGTNPNAAPSVSLTSPTAGAAFTSPANITVSANANDSDGSISKVEFYAGTTLIGTSTSTPYQITWGSVAAGSYSLTAVATDNSSASTVSAAVAIVVNLPNSLPSVSFNSPLEGTTLAAGSNIALSANASDGDGTISKVEFFAGSTLIGTSTTPTSGNLYSVSWNNVNSGGYALTAKATDNANGTTTSAVVNINVVAPAGLSPTADAYVRDGSSATTNFGTAATLQTQSSASAGNNRESYLKFDLTTVSGINKATVRLYGSLSDATASNVPAGVYSVATTTWVESGNGSITWNTRPAAGAMPLTTSVISDNVPRWYEFDVTPYLQAEKAAGRNVVSLVVKNTAQSSPFASFNSREATSNQPQLILWSTQPRNALLVVGSTTLNTGDNAIKTRLQNLGFTVTVKAAGSNNNTAIKTSDADGKTLVLISSTVTPANVTNKFRNVAVPVVTWEFDLFDDQGMTGTVSGTDFGTTTAQTDLVIVNSSHPLAAGLSAQQNVAASGSFNWGKPNTNAARIATLTGDATKFVIFGYENMATMPGLDAPARRVGLFLTDTTAASLTANGGLLLDAAVKWASELLTAPFINSLTPSNGPLGTAVIIKGGNFGSAQGTSTLTFNGVAGTPTAWGYSSVTVSVPAYATTGSVIVIVSGVASNGVTFAVGDTDSDGDGLPDWWEMQYFGNLNQGANGDPDGDGLTNLQEYQQGRNPTKSALADDGDFVNLRVHTPLAP